jgi:tetratricopeptide (TPR) repeat protein
MVLRIKLSDRDKIIILLLSFLLAIYTFPGNATGQSLTQDEFNKEFSKACLRNDDQLAVSLITGHRLYVKPFVNDLITRSITAELKGETAESRQDAILAGEAASTFRNVFGEKCLETGIGYLAVWSKEQKGKKLSADSLYALGLKLRGNKQEREKVLACYQQAMGLCKEIGDEWGEAEVLGGLGLYYWNTDYNKSLEFYQQALIKREKIDDRQLVGNSLNSIGSLYYSFIRDYNQAISYLERAEAVRIGIGDSMNLGRTIHVQASVYERRGQLEKSLEYYRRSYAINRKYGDHHGPGHSRPGGIHNSIGKYPGALENAEQLLQSAEFERSLKPVLSQIGFVYSNLGDYNTVSDKSGS